MPVADLQFRKSKEYIDCSMNEYAITKIVDGLFISDSLVPLDLPFLLGNKIICAVGWTADHQQLFTEEDGIRQVLLPKSMDQLGFPSFQQLQQAFQYVEQAREEMLCALIYSENELEAALICVMHLMSRYRWDCNTALSFLKTKMQAFEFCDQAIEGLENYESQLKKHCSQDLTHILWEYQFLINYHPVFDEEALLINTIRNKMRPCQPQASSKPSVKVLRVRWQDQIRPSSALKIASSKNLRRNSLNKNKQNSSQDQQQPLQNTSELQLLYQAVGYRSPPPCGLRSVPCKRQKEGEDDFDFMQLKEISRTNFNDRKYMGSKLRRKGSLKPRPQKTQSSINLHSVSALVGIYSSSGRPASGKNVLTRSGSSGQPFWSSLRAQAKLSMAHA